MTANATIFRLKAFGSPGPEPDLEQVRRAIGIFVDPAHGVQLQFKPYWTATTFHGSAVERIARHVAENGNAQGSYFTLNPINATLDGNAKCEDALCRRWLMIDLDRTRPTGEAERSNTEAEKEAIRQVATNIQEYLQGEDWPAPVMVDSGNGWHLYYRIDLPNDKLARVLVGGVLTVLAKQFDSNGSPGGCAVHVDKGALAGANAKGKLPGTWSRKGKDEPQHPHRMARLAFVPSAIEVVPAEKLRDLAGTHGELPKPPTQPKPLPWRLRAPGPARDSYVRVAIDSECARVVSAPARNNQLNKSAIKLSRYVSAGWVSREAIEAALFKAACQSGLDRDTGGQRAINATIKSGLDAGIKDPHQLPEFTVPPRSGYKAITLADLAEAVSQPKIQPGETIIYRGSSVTPRKVEWLWPGRIPIGKLTTFAGLGGLGKTFVLCDITARVTRGLDWPDSSGECCEPAQVLFISGEDDADDTLVPRLMELGADLEKVIFLKTEVQDLFTLADLDTLDVAFQQAGGNIRFIAIDPPAAYLGGVNEHKNAEVRALLTPLKSWAAKNRTAVVFNTHFNKGGQKVEAVMRIMGSVAWVNAVRAAHIFTPDPDDPERCFFIPGKMNLAKKKKGLAYRVVITPELARLEWLGEVDHTADDAVSNTVPKRRVIASQWLIEKFREKREWPSEDLFQAAKQENISRSAMFEAKATLNLPKARKEVDQAGNKTWIWWVPEDWEHLRDEEAFGPEGTIDPLKL